ESAAIIRDLIERLPPELRDVAEAKLAGMTLHEIAVTLEITTTDGDPAVSTAHRLVERVRDWLRADLLGEEPLPTRSTAAPLGRLALARLDLRFGIAFDRFTARHQEAILAVVHRFLGNDEAKVIAKRPGSVILTFVLSKQNADRLYDAVKERRLLEEFGILD